MKDASEQLLTLIGDLLELTALKRGAIVDIDRRSRSARAAARRDRQRQGDARARRAGRDEPRASCRRCAATGAKIAKALRALIDNAFKFTPKGAIACRASDRRRSGDYTVEDTGIGIPAEAHALIFDEFRQVDGTRTREYGGSGLGLSLARRLARLVQGEITLDVRAWRGLDVHVGIAATE